MNGRRALAELLVELADGVAALDVGGASPVQAHALSLSLPVDLRVVRDGTGPQISADVPLFRTRTDFDPEPARLQIDWHAVPVAPDSPT